MIEQEIRFDIVYKNKLPMEEDVYAYVRAWQGGEVGFSVVDKPSRNPDFSNCGVFWVAPEHFCFVFEKYKLIKSV